MKLATLRDGSRDGSLAVVSSDLGRAVAVPQIAKTLQAALDAWQSVEPELKRVAAALDKGEAAGAIAFTAEAALAPLPRAYQWIDASAYVTHVELVRKARGASMPETFWTDPLFYQGAGDSNLAPTDPIGLRDPAWGCDFEGEVAVITDDVPIGTTEAEAGRHIKLILLVNDVTLRNLVPPELAKGFGFFQSKPQTAFSPVAVTPDQLGDAWDGDRIHLPLIVHRGDKEFGHPNAGKDMVFGFRRLIEHAARTRPLVAGTILGAGTVSNVDRSVGSACIAEQRALEMIEAGEPRTPFLKAGERVSIEMRDRAGASIFGRIEQVVTAI
ncbi:fumarylacetoacetate (FAA) hydrolase [Rhizobiales bacterium GAS191]|nr:fumarylacetoacetate (FAA) hydrolase [Rhizobiales bacterium GAS191]